MPHRLGLEARSSTPWRVHATQLWLMRATREQLVVVRADHETSQLIDTPLDSLIARFEHGIFAAPWIADCSSPHSDRIEVAENQDAGKRRLLSERGELGRLVLGHHHDQITSADRRASEQTGSVATEVVASALRLAKRLRRRLPSGPDETR